ncbi:MAG TPA: DinB family protein [Bacillus pumilus]|nr:DinB family protein [Bacillus pumilus]HBU92358.1 DinB family protein [Bacillus pumilus]
MLKFDLEVMKMSLLHDARQELWQELQGLNEEQLNQKLSDDTWSIQEVAEHLKKMDLVAAKHLAAEGKKAPIKEYEPKPVEMAEDRSRKATAPSIVEPERKHVTPTHLKDELDTAREQLNQILSTFTEDDFKRVIAHPVFEELSLKQYLDFIGAHEKRHIHQIKEIKEQL